MSNWRTPCPKAGSSGFNGKTWSHRKISSRFALSKAMPGGTSVTFALSDDGDTMRSWMTLFSRFQRSIRRNRSFDQLPESSRSSDGTGGRLRVGPLEMTFWFSATSIVADENVFSLYTRKTK